MDPVSRGAHIASAIYEKLGKRVLLEQLAEEAAELSQAALKLIRAEGLSPNVTPVKASVAEDALLEEINDVALLCIMTMGYLPEAEYLYISDKLGRWAERLGIEV